MNAKKLDKLHLEYETMLVREIESLMGLAIAHGWKSTRCEAGKYIRQKLREAGSKIADEQS